MPQDASPEKFELRSIYPGDKLAGFSMGDAQFQPLKTFLQNRALDFQEKNLGRTYVLVGEGTVRVWGYITLICSQVFIEKDGDKPDDCEGAQQYEDFPAVKIARLAIDQHMRGRHLGSDLVSWAIATVRNEIMPVVGCRFLILDAKQCSVAFYEKLGFEVLAETEVKHQPVMFMDMHKLAEREEQEREGT